MKGKCWDFCTFTAFFLAAACLLAAVAMTACSGGSKGVASDHSLAQYRTTQNQCTQGTGGNAPQPPTCSPPPQWDIIVDNPGNNTATSYQFTTTGNATPVATLAPSNQLNGDYGIWFDGDTGDFFISNATGQSINRYPIGCLDGGSHSGMSCPDQTLSGSATGFSKPYAATENYSNMLPQGDEPAYTINAPSAPATPSIVAHLENASGNTTPLYSISGNKTLLTSGVGLAVDSTTGQATHSGGIYADAGAKIIMFLPSVQFPNPSPGQVINVAPYKSISGTTTGITNPIGLYCDVNGYLYVVNRSPDKILVFAPTASGNVAPVNSITTSLSSPYGVSVDTNLIVYVTNDGSPNKITEYTHGEGPNGSSTLKATISGSNTGLNSPANIDVRISR